MFNLIKDWREQSILEGSRFSEDDWRQVAGQLAVLSRLSEEELLKLFDLATLFLHDKSIKGAKDFVVTDSMKQSIALQACLPILNLGLEWYKGWSSIIVYPRSYHTKTTTTDEMGIVHEGTQHRSGEAWLRGPVVLSWREVEHSGDLDGQNVVVFASAVYE